MRARLLTACCISVISVVAAGCGTAVRPAAGGTPARSVSASRPTAVVSRSPSVAVGSPGSPTPTPSASATGQAACRRAGPAEELTLPGGLQFVSATRGWMASGDQILATTDGGTHWHVQIAGKLNLSSVDFINGAEGWAVGDDTLLATADGGGHWTALPEPCPVIRSVHFVSPLTGFAVAGGSNVFPVGLEAPEVGGVVLATSDGGRTWRLLHTPAGAQTVCFSDPLHGWLGAGGRLYRSTDGGGHWTVVTAKPEHGSAQFPATMMVQCAGGDAAWAVDVGPGAAMNQSPHVGYHADASGATAIFAEDYFQSPGTYMTQSPGSEAGPFSAISPSVAAFFDSCPACGYGAAPWGMATGSGARLIREGNVGHITFAVAASFISPQVGWVAGDQVDYQPSRAQERIVFTDDGGRTWHLQYAGPWTG